MRHYYEKVCPVCGKSFKTLYKKHVCCSRVCSHIKAGRTLRTLSYQRSVVGKRREMLGRLADRDAAYAENAAPITIEERDLRNSEFGQIMRIEWRGQRVIGCRAADRVRHNS